MRHLTSLASLVALSLVPSVGAACSLAAPAYTFSGGAPRDEASLNSPIYVDLAHSFGGLSTAAVLKLEEVASGARVELKEVYTHYMEYGERSVLSFVPTDLLAPHTRYRAILELASAQGSLGEGSSWEFSTADELIPPMAATGELTLTHEQGRAPRMDACDTCGICSVSGEDLVTKVRVVIPPVSGGSRDYGLKAHVVVTNDTPYTTFAQPPEVTVAAVVDLTTTSLAELSLRPLKSGQAFRPCVTVKVRDGRNDTLELEPKCFEPVAPVLQPIDDAGEEPIDEPVVQPGGSDEPDNEANGSRTTSACSMGPSVASGLWHAVLLAAGVGALRSRRRPTH